MSTPSGRLPPGRFFFCTGIRGTGVSPWSLPARPPRWSGSSTPPIRLWCRRPGPNPACRDTPHPQGVESRTIQVGSAAARATRPGALFPRRLAHRPARTVGAQRPRPHPQRCERRRYVLERRAAARALGRGDFRHADPVAAGVTPRIDALHGPAGQVLHILPHPQRRQRIP